MMEHAEQRVTPTRRAAIAGGLLAGAFALALSAAMILLLFAVGGLEGPISGPIGRAIWDHLVPVALVPFCFGIPLGSAMRWQYAKLASPASWWKWVATAVFGGVLVALCVVPLGIERKIYHLCTVGQAPGWLYTIASGIGYTAGACGTFAASALRLGIALQLQRETWKLTGFGAVFALAWGVALGIATSLVSGLAFGALVGSITLLLFVWYSYFMWRRAASIRAWPAA